MARSQMCILIALVLVATACRSNAGDALPTPFFPRQIDPMPDTMDALLVGKLVLLDGCLYVDDGFGHRYLPIWPHNFALSVQGDVVQILDDTGQPVARVGDEVKIGGGEVPADQIARYSLQPLFSQCPAPYWLVGQMAGK